MLRIKSAAALTGLTVKAIRYYEALGLCVPSARTETGYRLYSEEDLARLRLIRHYRDLMFSLREISELLDAPAEDIFAAMERQHSKVLRNLEVHRRALSALDTFLGSDQLRTDRVGRMAVIGIDLQNDILEGGSLPSKRIYTILPQLRDLFERARQMSVPVIYVCDSHKPGDLELLLWTDHMMEGTWGAQIIDAVSPGPKDLIVKKGLFNGFTKTNLQDTLDALDIHTLIITGWRTEVCVAQTAIEGFYRGYRIVIAEDGVNSTTEKEHRFGLAMLQVNYGFELYPCASVLQALIDSPEP